MTFSVFNALVVPDASVAQATGSIIDLTSAVAAGSCATLSGSAATGTVVFQVSCDAPPGFGNSRYTPAQVKNWSSIASLSAQVTGPGSFLIPTADVSYMWGRFIWTNAGQTTGSLSVMIKTTHI